jgi:maltose O-acetyltransferase
MGGGQADHRRGQRVAGRVIVCPGVSIGENTVVGAGAVVVRDLPANVSAVGNPAKVIRSL